MPPDSAFLLDSIRPDFLLLKTIARNLIMWKYVLPSQKWVINQLSAILKTNLKSDPVLFQKFSHLIISDKPSASVQKNNKENSSMKKTSISNFPNMKKSKSKTNLKLEVEENSALSDNDNLNEAEDEFDVNTDEDDNVLINKVSF